MAKRTPLIVAAIALMFQTAAFAQATFRSAPQPTASQSFQPPATATVQQLAPQLLAFAGSTANFQSLVNGLAQGLPVTLVTTSAEGLTQSVTFTPAGTMSALDVARVLEQSRQNLIARGIATPTAQQLGVALTGGNLTTALGAVPMSALVPIAAAGTPAGAASAGSSISSNVPGAASAGASALPQVPATAGPRVGQPRFTSDAASVVGTSDTPRPATPSVTPAVPFGTSNSPVPVTGAPAAAANGAPSPAAQIQGRR